MTGTEAVVFIAINCVLVIGLIRLLDFIEKDAQNTWWPVAEGVYVSSISKSTDHRTSTKMTGYYAKLPGLIWTTLVFKDGSTSKVINIDQLPPPGTYIKIIKNGRADFKIESVKTV